MQFHSKTSRISAKGQLKRAAGKMAHKLAKANKDPLQMKYEKLMVVLKKIKMQLAAKYGRRGVSAEMSKR